LSTVVIVDRTWSGGSQVAVVEGTALMASRTGTDSSTAEPLDERTGDVRNAHLVVGHDQSQGSQTALLVGADFANHLNAHLHVVHVVDLSDYPVDPDLADWEEQAQAKVAREEALVRLSLQGQNLWTYHLMRGDAVTSLTTVADEYSALMIIIGSRGGRHMNALLGWMLGGSISHGLNHKSRRPVLVVPPGVD
jgi:nucleotide-binding universal stress UspA family protein